MSTEHRHGISNVSQLLLEHGIMVSPGDPRSSEQIAEAYGLLAQAAGEIAVTVEALPVTEV